ncbi:MAG: hypothetical protein IMZ67_09200 [Acidobacteria bacterium]|nr:hypothetical protein [Acidobacteriota bacterium]
MSEPFARPFARYDPEAGTIEVAIVPSGLPRLTSVLAAPFTSADERLRRVLDARRSAHIDGYWIAEERPMHNAAFDERGEKTSTRFVGPPLPDEGRGNRDDAPDPRAPRRPRRREGGCEVNEPYRGVPWPTQDGALSIGATTRSVEIECDACPQSDWPGDRGIVVLSVAAARKRAHRHIATTGHTVRVWQSTERVYGPDTRPTA